MAIMQMQRIQICALKKDRKKILELLQRRGIVEIDERIEPDALVTKTDTSQTSAVFAKNAAAAAEALRVLQEYAPEKNSMLSSLEGKSVETVATYNAFYKGQPCRNRYCAADCPAATGNCREKGRGREAQGPDPGACALAGPGCAAQL